MTEERLKEIEARNQSILKGSYSAFEVFAEQTIPELIAEVRGLKDSVENRDIAFKMTFEIQQELQKQNERLLADIKECRRFCFDWSKENDTLKALLREAREKIWWVRRTPHDTESVKSLSNRIDLALGEGK